MKYILTFIVIGFISLNVSAQKENTAFLEKRSLEVLDKESQVLLDAINAIDNALTQKDNKLMGSNKSRMIKSLRILANHCNVIAAKVSSDRVALAEKKQVNSDFSNGLRAYMRNKAQDHLQELGIDNNGDQYLTARAEKIQKLWNKLQSNKLEFHPSQKNSVANLSTSREILNSVEEFNTLIKSGVISE